MRVILIVIAIVPLCLSVTLPEILDKLAQNLHLENVSQMCRNQMVQFKENWNNPQTNPWALEMVDASSKIPSGMMSLNVASLGNFDQCIKISTTSENDNPDTVISGKYCLGFVSVDTNTATNESLQDNILVSKLSSFPQTTRIQGPTWSMCVPRGCSAADVTLMIYNFTQDLLQSSQLQITFNDFYCQTKQDVYPELTTAAIVTLSILATYGGLIIAATIYDIVCAYRNVQRKQTIVAFSAYSNSKKLFAFSRAGEEQIPCLNGLRFLSIVWVVAGHQYSITAGGPIENTASLVDWSERLYSMFLISGTISVDTFLAIGGSLISYTFLKSRRQGRRFNLAFYYVHRYVRLTPPLAAVVLISSTLLIYMGSGPRWPSLKLYFQGNCEHFWWTALLYVQNYANVRTMCIGQTWYLDIDWQLYLISPVLLLGLAKWPKKTLCFVILCAVLSMAASFQAAWHYDLTAILSNIYGNAVDYSNEYYLRTHTRASPWLIGFVLGYYIFAIKTGDIKWRIKQSYVTLLWLLFLALLLMCALVGHSTLRSQNYDKWGNVLHITFIRPLWSVGICWIILASISDKGFVTGIVNGFLSLPIFQVLNRFTYSIYLTHVTMMFMIAFAKKTPDYFSDFEMAHKFWGTLWFGLGLSLVWVLAFESPTIALEKILLGRSTGQKEWAIKGAVNGGFEQEPNEFNKNLNAVRVISNKVY